MENDPVDIEQFIKLVTTKELGKQWIKLWFKVVKKLAPSGTLDSVQQTDPEGNPQNVRLVHSKIGNEHHYIIPVTRHFQDSESQKIIEVWQDLYPYENWEVQSSADAYSIPQVDEEEVIVDGNAYNDLCRQIAKHQHNRWCEKRVQEGWRYSTKFSRKDKTHPMLQPWEKLPEDWREVDFDLPQMVIDTLNEQGYKVVQKS